MSEETENVETQEADAPLINVDAKEEETQAEAPMPLHDEPEEQELSEEDDDEVFERPDYYPEKFWDDDGPDVEKLAKSYAELEKKHLDPASIKHRKVITMFRIWLIVASIWKIRLLRYIRTGLNNTAFHRKRLRTWLVKFWR